MKKAVSIFARVFVVLSGIGAFAFSATANETLKAQWAEVHQVTDAQVAAFLDLNPRFRVDATPQGIGELLRMGWVSYHQAEVCSKFWDINPTVIPDITLRLGFLEKASVATGVASQASMDQFRDETRASILSQSELENAEYSARQNKDRMCESLTLWSTMLETELNFDIDTQAVPRLQ